MVFSSMIFIWVFLPVVFIGYRLLGFICRANAAGGGHTQITLQNMWLLAASLVFYAWGEPKFVFLMIVSIAVNYIAGLAVGNAAGGGRRKLLLALAVFANLAVLGYFKYFSTSLALLQRVSGLDAGSIPSVVLPIGISFYTFQALSYVIDVYRGVNKPQRNPLTLALYICLFPQLVAGPIVKYRDICEQLALRTTNSEQTAYGIRRFVYGLGKKVLIANQLAGAVDAVYALPSNEISTGLAWSAALLYTMQIYFDFSGYSDMAIGLGKMFGFTFMENFNLPYLSRSIQEFWRRWHISLSTWFKEYLYIPLGGNRKGKARTYLNLGVVFFCTGVWHGAGLLFIVWGLYHGAFMLIERVGFKRVLNSQRARVWSHLYALFVVVVGWVPFRADSLGQVGVFLHAMFTPTAAASYSVLEVVGMKAFVVFVAACLLCGPLQALIARVKGSEVADFLVRAGGVEDRYAIVRETAQIALLSIVLILSVVSLIAGAYNPFIYFRF